MENAWNNGGFHLAAFVKTTRFRARLIETLGQSLWVYEPYECVEEENWEPRLAISIVESGGDFRIKVLANSRDVYLKSNSNVQGRNGISGWWDEADVIPGNNPRASGQIAVAHEFGHLIGLEHPGPPGSEEEYSKDPKALMGKGTEMRANYYIEWAQELTGTKTLLGKKIFSVSVRKD